MWNCEPPRSFPSIEERGGGGVELLGSEPCTNEISSARDTRRIEGIMGTEEKSSKADYKRAIPLEVFDHQIDQTLATDVIGVSFEAQR